ALIHFFMYFPSEQIFILANGYLEIAVLAIDKKLDVDVSWYEVEEYCSVEIIKKRFSNVLIKNYRNFS
ncbi:hypothetical protein ACY3DX_002802, partial [Listeria monocytogenes]